MHFAKYPNCVAKHFDTGAQLRFWTPNLSERCPPGTAQKRELAVSYADSAELPSAGKVDALIIEQLTGNNDLTAPYLQLATEYLKPAGVVVLVGDHLWLSWETSLSE